METFNATCEEVKTTASTEKGTATIFWDIHTIILIDFMPRSVMVTRAAHQVSLQCLKEAIQQWQLGLLTLSVLIMLGCILFTPQLPCCTPGIGNMFPTQDTA